MLSELNCTMPYPIFYLLCRCGEVLETLLALFSRSGAQADSSMVALCLFQQLLQITGWRNILIEAFSEISLSNHEQF